MKAKNKFIIGIHTLFLILISLIMIIYPSYISKFIDNMGSQNLLIQIALIIIALLVGKNILKLLDLLLVNYLENYFEFSMKKDLVEKVLYSNYLDIVSVDKGKLINLNNDIQVLIDFLINFLSILFKNALLLAGILYVSFKKLSYMSIVFVLMILFLFYLFKRIKEKSSDKVRQSNESYDRMVGLFSETLSLLDEFSFIGKGKYLVGRLRSGIVDFFNKEVVSNFISYEYRLSSISIFGLMKILILVLGIFTLKNNILSIGSLYLFIYYIDLIEDPIYDVRLQLESLPNVGESKRRLEELEKFRKMSYGDRTLDDKVIEITLDNVNFSYPSTNKLIFKNFNLSLTDKLYGLSSPSGSGKSTLINLIARLFDVDGGAIKYNGIDIRDLRKGEISKRLEYIDQRIRANDSSLIGDILNESEESAKLLKTFGMNKSFDDKTSDLSDGEYRSLFIIKALLSNKDILILDEIFLGVDETKCSLFFDLIKNTDKIVLIISHEKRIIDRVDEVIDLERN
ncbi:MAG: ABC transporter ATP-binding protein [Peptoniphilaceae bacterium]|nr:ABC transporter ATP-binding protein [Peptoniphilaceae bacterium]